MTLLPLWPKEAKLFLSGMVTRIIRRKPDVPPFDANVRKEFSRPRQTKPGGSTTSRPKPADNPVPRPREPQALTIPSFPRPAKNHEPSSAYGKRTKSTMMDPSALTWQLERATTFYNFAMAALVVGAIITIAATIGLIWSSGMKSRYADEHLANAFARQEQAKAEAAKANERAAELLLRAQQAQLDQEKTHLELEHVRAISGPRRISSEQRAKIIKALLGHPMTINLLSPSNDPEAKQFADDLTATLRAAGLTVNVATSVLFIPMHGLGMTMSSSETGSALYAALRGADLKINDLPERNPIMLVVGSKK